MNAPILLFVYNRPQHVRHAVQSLLQNSLAEESELYIYSDAPKNITDEPKVSEVRRYIRTISGFKNITIVERGKNLGLAESVIDGVTSLVEHFGKVIVMEDDLIAAPYFLQFMNEALTLYENEPRIGHIQGCEYTQDPSLPNTFLIKWAGSWGWGTWKRAWKLFNPDGQALLTQLKKRHLTHLFDFNGTYGYTKMLRNQIAEKNSSWAIRWYASLFLADVLSLNAGHSLINNNGFDGSGTHCGGGNLYRSTLWLHKLPVEKIFPIEENEQARNILIHYHRRTNGFWAKAIRRIKRTLQGDFGK